jgi:3-oxoacyl-[acyl-carrier-protein] synthase-1
VSGKLEVVALGARTPVGLTAESSAAAVRAGISTYREFPFICPTGEPVVVAADARIAPLVEGRERLVPLGVSVLDEILGKLGAWEREVNRCRLLLSLPETRPGFSDDDAAWVADALRTHVQSAKAEIRVEIAGRGHAGSVLSAERAVQECAHNPDDLFLTAGVDSYHHAATYLWLESDRRFTQPGIRSGFAPGEGAGCLALASPATRNRLRLPRLAVLRGVRTAQETLLRGSETGSFGVAMTKAVEGAVAGLALPREAIDVLYTDINGERYRSEEWGFVALRTPGVWNSHVYEAPCDCWGDVGAAFGTLAAALAVQSFVRRYARGPRALVMAGSDGGLRGAMVLQDPQSQG